MKRILKIGLLWSLLLGLSLSCVQEEWPREDYAFSTDDDLLIRGDDPFDFRGLWMPDLGAPGVSHEAKIAQLNRLCLVGGNSALVELEPTYRGPEGVSAEWLEALLRVSETTRWRQLGLVLRIMDVENPGETARMVGQLFPKRWDIIFWFAGPRSEEATRIFKDETDYLLTAGLAENRFADVTISPDEGTVSGERPLIRLYPSSGSDPLPPHFVLRGESALDRLRENFGAEKTRPELLDDLEPDDEGFLPLFNGRDFSGWEITGDPGGWKVEDGAIVWVERGGRYVRTQATFDDFVLRLEFSISEGGNSGVFLRAPAAGRHSRIGMEFQILGDAGEAPHKNGTGSIYDVRPPGANASRPAGEWNDVEISCDGTHLRAVLNGTLIHDFDLDSEPELRNRLREGFIMLQDHGHPVRFRNIRIKPL